MAASWAMDMVGVIFPIMPMMMPGMTMLMNDTSGPRKNREQSEKIDEQFRFHNSIAVILFPFPIQPTGSQPIDSQRPVAHLTPASRFLLS